MTRTILEIIGIILLIFCLYDLTCVNYGKPVKLVYRLTKSYSVQLAVQALLLLISFALILQGLVPALISPSGKPLTVLRLLLFILGAALSVAFFLVAVSPNKLIFLLRGKNAHLANRTTGHPAGPEIWEEKYWLVSDIPFDSAYPNSFFDLYSCEKEPSTPRPVFLYAHGGGFIFGDKSNGDPNALGIPGIIRMIRSLVDAGFVVISTDYALAPEQPYPAPLCQMNDLLQFLCDHAPEYGLDMTRVVVGGGSAGGHLMAQLAAIQTDFAYANQVGIKPVLTHGEIKAVYHGCALLDCGRFGHTGNGPTDYLFYQMGRAYYHTGVLEGHPKVLESDVVSHVSAHYPPSYICDGNVGTFNAQAHDLEDRLKALGVKTKALIFDEPGAKRLPHGFDTLEHQRGYRSMEEMVSFVKGEVFGNG